MAVLVPPQQMFAFDLFKAFLLVCVIIYISGLALASFLFVRREKYQFKGVWGLIQLIWIASYLFSALLLIASLLYFFLPLPVLSSYQATVRGPGPAPLKLNQSVYYNLNTNED